MKTTQNTSTEINTPTQRLSNEDIYNDISFLVQEQVDEMLTRGGTNEFNWSNATNYTDDILNGGMTYGWLVGLCNGDKDEFADCVNNSMNEHNGWKNETTWTINVFFMETIEKMLKEGSSHENIEFQIKRQLNQDLYLEQRNILNCALKLVDWDTLIARATENVEKEKVA